MTQHCSLEVVVKDFQYHYNYINYFFSHDFCYTDIIVNKIAKCSLHSLQGKICNH